MKARTLKLLLIYTLLLPLCAAIFCGCEQDEIGPWEIFPDSETTVVQNVVDGIEFRFGLLNEAGEAATVFNEGENFTFLFSIKNRKLREISYTYEFIVDDFYRVYRTSSNELIDMGKPWTGIFCEFVLTSHESRLKANSESQIKCPWVVTETNKPGYPLCMGGESKDFLTVGEYVTSFDFDFHYKINNQEKSITGETFKINFKVQ
jgi:hypothetical protein